MPKIPRRGKRLSCAILPIVESLESRTLFTAIVAGFGGGNGSSSVDQYGGTSGSGWAGGWHSLTTGAAITSSVVSTNPLNGNGNYLASTLTASGGSARGAISRGYQTTGNITVSSVHELQMDFRVDSSLSTFTTGYDQVYIYGDNGVHFAPGVSSSDTIFARAQGASLDSGAIAAKHWVFNDGTGGTNVDSGVTLTQGTTYHFTFLIDPANNQYTAYVTDGTAGTGHTYQSGTLGWANDLTFTSGSTLYIESGARVDTVGESLAFSMDSFSVTPPPPTAPSSVTGSAASSSQINLSWADNSSTETGFVVQRSTDNATWTTVTTTAANATSYSDTGLTAGTSYYYRLHATNEGGDSSNAAPASPISTAGSGPTIVTAASVTPGTVTGTTASLSVLGGPSGSEAGLTYAWSATVKPTGAANPTYSANGTNAAKNTTVTFSQAGTYTLRATVSNGSQNTTSDVNVTVNQTLTSIVVTPANPSVGQNATQQFAASAKDQFGAVLSVQPTFTWSVTSGAGSINTSGLFTAGVTIGSYTVSAVSGSVSGSTGVAVGTVVPTAPSTLVATATSATVIALSWADNSNNETGFKIERSTDNATWTLVTTTAANATSYSDTGRTASTLYYYRVRATDSAGDSSNATASATTSNSSPTVATPATASPSTVTGTNASLSVLGSYSGGESALTYTWSMLSEPSGATNPTYSSNGVNASKNSTVTFSQSGTYTLRATISNGTQNVTSDLSIVVLQTATGISVTPSSPSIDQDASQQFTATENDQFGIAMASQPTITWSASGGGSITSSGLFVAGTSTGTYTISAASGSISGASSVSVGTAIPAAPSGLVAGAESPTQISIAWTDNSDNESRFRVERSTDNASWTALATTDPDVNYFDDAGLDAGTLYYYRVRATNSAGDSANTTASASTWVGYPPGDVDVLSDGGTSLFVSWLPTDSTSPYTVAVSADYGSTWTNVGTASSSDSGFVVDNLDPNTAYMAAVGYGDSPASTGNVTSDAATTQNSDQHTKYIVTVGSPSDFSVGERDDSGTGSAYVTTPGPIEASSADEAVKKAVSGNYTDTTYDYEYTLGTGSGAFKYSPGYIGVEDRYDDPSSNDHDYNDGLVPVTVSVAPTCPQCNGQTNSQGQATSKSPQLTSSNGLLTAGAAIGNDPFTGDNFAGVGTTSETHLVVMDDTATPALSLVTGGLGATEFTNDGSGVWKAIDGSIGTITSDDDGYYIYSDGKGLVQKFTNPQVFDEYSSIGSIGRLMSSTMAGGGGFSYDAFGAHGAPTEAFVTDAAGNQQEKWTYTYDTTSSGANAGRQLSVLQQLKDGSGSWAPYRTLTYTYYSTGDAYGSGGDLKTATITDSTGKIVDESYYRYYVFSETGGHAHLLKSSYSLASIQRLEAAYSTTNLDSLSTSQVQPYADTYLTYDSDDRVASRSVQGEGCSTCSGGIGTTTYAYAESTFADGPNSWRYKVTATTGDGTQIVTYSNFNDQTMLSVTIDATSGQKSGTFYKYDSDGNQVLEADASALALPSSLSTLEAYADLLHNVSGNYQYLNDSSGLITATDYYGSTTATTYTAGGADGYEEDSKVYDGETATGILQSSEDYIAHSDSNGATIYSVADSTQYRNTNGTGAETTSYAYTWFTGMNQIASQTMTAPVVSASQNGPATSDATTTIYDANGRVIWTKDGGGFLTYNAYDTATGGLLKTIQDVATSNTSDYDATLLPSGWSTPSGGGLNLVTTYQVDHQGRMTEETDPDGNVSYTVYNDGLDASTGFQDEVRTYSGWRYDSSLGKYTTTGPVTVTRRNLAGNYTETLTYAYMPATGVTVPVGTDSISSVQSLSRSLMNDAGQVVETDQYSSLSGVTYSASSFHLGTAGTNYYVTTYAYDQRGRQKRLQDPTGTINWTLYDDMGRVKSTWVGTNDAGAVNGDPTGSGTPGNNMVKTADYVYDNGGVGDGNLTSMTQYPNATGVANRVSKMFYDWRDREVATVSGDGDTGNAHFITYTTLDNLGEATSQSTYNGDSSNVTLSSGVPTVTGGTLVASSTTSYDDQGRVYQSNTYSVDPISHSVSSSSLASNTFYDHRGNVIEQTSSGQATQKMTYDGAGRETVAYTTDRGGDATIGGSSAWTDAGNVTGDTVLEQVETTYDAAGNAILTTDRQRFDNATATGALGNPSSTGTTAKARVSYEAMYYDAANRMTDDVNVGTNGGSTYTRPGTVPSRSDTALVTSYGYDAAGMQSQVTDPRGLVSKTFYDALGRTTKTIADYVDGTPSTADDQTTESTYDGAGHVLTLKADLPGGTFQQTQYVYGATTARGDGINSNDVLIATKYPDPSTGVASSGQQETYTTDALGDRLTMADRNGSTHTYSYDVLGRQTADAVTTLGSGVDGAVRRLATAYDAQGNAYLFTSYDSATAGAVVNQVQDTFNGLGQLTNQSQSTAGTVSGSTPAVSYAYDTLAHGSRMTSMTYPSTRVLTYSYGTSGGLNDTISRLDSISDTSATLESYKYLGLSTVVERDHPQDNINLTYIGTGTGDGGDQYLGLDRFGRVVDQKWVNASGTAVDEYQYGYDRDGNVLYKNNVISSGNSELYAYDGLNRLTTMSRGTLNGTDTALTGSATRSQSWNLDALGKSTTVTSDGTTQSRSSNDQNQLTTMGSSTLAYDANGNETTDDTGKTLVYDAWNRLVEAKSGSTSLIRYAFDALGHRDKEGSTSIYFTANWQEIEDRNSSGQVTAQYVYSPVYIDAMIERDRDTNADGVTDERLYVTQDANYNVAAIATTSGTVAERFEYDAYGTRTVLSSSWSSATDAYSFMQGHQGGKIDAATGYVNFRNRDLNTAEMTWMEQDPWAYVDGANVYSYELHSPIMETDPQGTTSQDNRYGLSDDFWTWWEREGKAANDGRDIENMQEAQRMEKQWHDLKNPVPGGGGNFQRGGKRGRGGIATPLMNLIGLSVCETVAALQYNKAVSAADKEFNDYVNNLKLLDGKELDRALDAALDAHKYEVFAAGTEYTVNSLACLCPFSLHVGGGKR